MSMATTPIYIRLIAAALLTTVLTACFQHPDISLQVLSSNQNQISGDDVLLGLTGEDADSFSDIDQLEFWLNNSRVQPTIRSGRNGPEILVSGLTEGANRFEVHHAEYGPLDALVLKAHPVAGPIFSGPQQYPFVCTVTTELG